ncbi:MAG TPA: c-type cytochrome [Thermoanaerobaculia bacterium]|nr:c-type cytochrome [Thermoanaerobaculia bacterium]
MKKTILITMILTLAFGTVAFAAEDGAALFKSKCAACHGPDGKKMAKADLTSAGVQEKGEADLVKFVGENPKHNFIKKGVSEEQIKAIVGFIKTLK